MYASVHYVLLYISCEFRLFLTLLLDRERRKLILQIRGHMPWTLGPMSWRQDIWSGSTTEALLVVYVFLRILLVSGGAETLN